MKKIIVREPWKMPIEVRLTYGKLLGLMILAQHRPEAAAMEEFYRALKKMEMKDKDRQVIFEYMMDPDQPVDDLTQVIMKVQDDQERNILRFSLLEDLYRIMRADFYEDEDEKKYFDSVMSRLKIEPHHLKLVIETYEKEDLYLPGTEMEPVSNRIIRYSFGLAVGIATAGLYVHIVRNKKGKNKSVENFAGITTGLAAFQATQYLMGLKGCRRRWIKKKLLKEKLRQEQQMMKDIKKDVRMIRQLIKKKSSQFTESFSWQDVIILLEKTLAYLEKQQ
ncbi:MAG: hypothetical protein D5S00_05755 [Tindallia sp. MSAO_Bac2]|nr:MAG: hypothetical protein D5S00_05755 [Tindallia sp. MSAO_Bac2]